MPEPPPKVWKVTPEWPLPIDQEDEEVPTDERQSDQE